MFAEYKSVNNLLNDGVNDILSMDIHGKEWVNNNTKSRKKTHEKYVHLHAFHRVVVHLDLCLSLAHKSTMEFLVVGPDVWWRNYFVSCWCSTARREKQQHNKSNKHPKIDLPTPQIARKQCHVELHIELCHPFHLQCNVELVTNIFIWIEINRW